MYQPEEEPTEKQTKPEKPAEKAEQEKTKPEGGFPPRHD